MRIVLARMSGPGQNRKMSKRKKMAGIFAAVGTVRAPASFLKRGCPGEPNARFRRETQTAAVETVFGLVDGVARQYGGVSGRSENGGLAPGGVRSNGGRFFRIIRMRFRKRQGSDPDLILFRGFSGPF